MTDQAGNYNNATDRSQHLPFGALRDGTPSYLNDITDRGFTGHAENSDIGLTYMNARFYVGSIARFASADTIIPNPLNPQAFNRYSYVLNNPINLIDPSGHCYEQYEDDEKLLNQCLSEVNNARGWFFLNHGEEGLEKAERYFEHLRQKGTLDEVTSYRKHQEETWFESL